ncbi:ABC transporter ATP-binding protein [Tritonibacter mobilis]|uniref:ABC transporter ATP-binding protein n=1 Tax=Tritonibacter mobilis TaxID=379347 RepID=UPI000806D9E2|nr:ATP-binding cassette domain-containing protein [Tritonibacter mobilis]
MIELRNLSLSVGDTALLQDINLSVATGETLALLGPSGAGKSSLARLLLRLLEGQPSRTLRHKARHRGFHWSGQAIVAGTDVLSASVGQMRHLRGNQIGLITQSLSDALNPQLTMRAHVAEVLALHQITDITPEQVFATFNLPPGLLERRPAYLSGGEVQRVLIALSLLPKPKCLILDEPTAALDPANQTLTVKAMAHGRAQRAQILITHDPALALSVCDHIAVLDQGRIVETGTPRDLQRQPQHPKSRAMIQQPNDTAPGTVTAPSGPDVLRVHQLSHCYGARPVLRNLSFSLRAGECLAVLGPSGCGKSTLARLVAGMEPLQSGQIIWSEATRPARPSPRPCPRPCPCQIGYVSQFPHRALTAHFSVAQTLAEALSLSQGRLRWFQRPRHSDPATRTAICNALTAVSLPTDAPFLARLTRDLSGGEAQRLCLARALLMQPQVIIADEPTSSLDQCAAAEVIKTLSDLKQRAAISILLITHAPAVAQALADQQLTLRQISPPPAAMLRRADQGANVEPTPSLIHAAFMGDRPVRRERS